MNEHDEIVASMIRTHPRIREARSLACFVEAPGGGWVFNTVRFPDGRVLPPGVAVAGALSLREHRPMPTVYVCSVAEPDLVPWQHDPTECPDVIMAVAPPEEIDG